MKRVAALACALACASDGYLDSATARRAILEASLVEPNNGYSALRLARYATGEADDWERLPIWNPPSEPLTLDTLATPTAPLSSRAAPLDVATDLRALGEDAFFRYPVQLLSSAEISLIAADPSPYGFWSDPTRGVGGLVRVRVADGSVSLAYTCATCHVLSRTGALVVGMTNASLDLGKLIIDASHGADTRAALLEWGAGRVDVTTNEGTEPERIPDLRPVRVLSHLHATASVEQRNLDTLAVRLETLLIVNSSQTVRPPLEIALGLATFVWSLDEQLEARAASSADELRGRTVFDEQCAGCHVPPSFTGPPVPIAILGTDPAVGLSLDRHTGNYRVPSLRGVGDRPLLLHDASAMSLDEMFDPARTGDAYHGRLGGPIVGHVFGLDLGSDDRAALVAFLKTL